MIEVAGRRLALGTGQGVQSCPLRAVGLMVTVLPTLVACATQTQHGPPRPSAPVPVSPTVQVPLTADSHLHILDFLQNGEYLVDGRLVYSSPANTLPAGERGRRIEAVLWAMDQANVSHAVIAGMPFLKKWAVGDPSRPTYYLDSSSRVVRARDTDYVLALAIEDYRRVHGAAAQLERLFPFVSGFDGTDLGAVDMIVKRIKEFPGVFKGIGEVMSRHDDLTNLTTGERPHADHPALFRIFDFAGRVGLPVSIHHNVAPISPQGEARDTDYLPELLHAFNEFPNTTFIWCHAGISRRIVVDSLPVVLASVLATHRNHVYIDLSWVVYEDYVLEDLSAWTGLIERYPDNFVIGSDAVGRYEGYEDTVRRYDRLLSRLTTGAAEKVARDNLLRIIPEDGTTLDPGYVYPEEAYTRRGGPDRSR